MSPHSQRNDSTLTPSAIRGRTQVPEDGTQTQGVDVFGLRGEGVLGFRGRVLGFRRAGKGDYLLFCICLAT